MITPLSVLVAARDLRSDRGESAEYNQGLVDLTAALLTINTDLARDLILGEGIIR